MLIDTHCHLNKLNILENARLAGVQRFINIGCNINESIAAREISTNLSDVYFSAGIHPNDSIIADNDYINKLRRILKDKKCIGVGECGLDYYRNSNHSIQKKFFESQIQLAWDFNKPLIVHVRDAYNDCVALLKDSHHLRGKIIHCFSGDIKDAYNFLNIGCCLSISGIVTFNNSKKFHDIISMIPMNRLLIETDAPYLTPVPYRGIINESQFIQLTLKKISEIKFMPISEIIKNTGQNAMKIFWPEDPLSI